MFLIRRFEALVAVWFLVWNVAFSCLNLLVGRMFTDRRRVQYGISNIVWQNRFQTEGIKKTEPIYLLEECTYYWLGTFTNYLQFELKTLFHHRIIKVLPTIETYQQNAGATFGSI